MPEPHSHDGTTDATPTPQNFFERWIAPYFRKPDLWPVMLVLIAHAVLGLGIALIEVQRGGGAFPWSIVLLCVGLGVAAIASDARAGRPRLATGICASVWLGAVVAAVGADRAGIY